MRYSYFEPLIISQNPHKALIYYNSYTELKYLATIFKDISIMLHYAQKPSQPPNWEDLEIFLDFRNQRSKYIINNTEMFYLEGGVSYEH